MNHHHDVSACRESLPVAGLLIPAIAIVGIMNKGMYPKAFSEGRSFVFAGIIDKDFYVHDVGKFPHGPFQGSLGVVRRHYHRDTLAIDHGLTLLTAIFLKPPTQNFTYRKATLS